MALEDQVFCNPGWSQCSHKGRRAACQGFSAPWKSSCGRGGKWRVVTARKVQCKGLGCVQLWALEGGGRNWPRHLGCYQALARRNSNISGNHSLARDGRCLWRLCARFCYRGRIPGEVNSAFPMGYRLTVHSFYAENPNFRLEGISVQSEECL